MLRDTDFHLEWSSVPRSIYLVLLKKEDPRVGVQSILCYDDDAVSIKKKLNTLPLGSRILFRVSREALFPTDLFAKVKISF